MIKQIKLKDGVKEINLGYLAIKAMSSGQEKGLAAMDMIEDVALAGFQTAAKRNGTDIPTREDIQDWFDDLSFYLAVQEAVEEFSVNFSKEAEKLRKKAKK